MSNKSWIFKAVDEQGFVVIAIIPFSFTDEVKKAEVCFRKKFPHVKRAKISESLIG